MSSEHKRSSQPPDGPRDSISSKSDDDSSRVSEPGEPLRGSMADLERELASLLDDAPLLPEDDEESDTDFEPPPGVRPGPWVTPPGSESGIGEPAPAPEPPAPAATDVAQGSDALPSAASSTATPKGTTRPSKRTSRRRSKASASKSDEPGATQTRAPTPVETRSRSRAVVTLLVVGVVLGLGWYLNRGTAAPTTTTQEPTHGTTEPPPPQPSPTTPARDAPSPMGPRAQPGEAAGATASLGPSATTEAPGPPAPSPPAPSPPAPSALAATTPAGQSSEDAPKFDMVKMLAALAPAGIQASRCRRTNDRKGKVFVRVEFAAGGAITTVDAGHAYKGSETAACIERKIRAAKVPVFSGEGGTVVLPVTLK